MDHEVNVLDGAGETFILLGIVVLQSNLKFNTLCELTLLSLKTYILMDLLIKDETSEPQRLKLERVTKSTDLDIHSETFQIKGFKFNSWAIHQEQEPITNNEKKPGVCTVLCLSSLYNSTNYIALSSMVP